MTAPDDVQARRGQLSPRAHRELLREAARLPGGVWVTCAGRSMEPTVALGERVRVEAARDVHEVRAGDVVLIARRWGYLLHRVVFRVPGTPWLVHIGDADLVKRPALAHASRVVGRAALPRRRPGPAVALAGVARVLSAAGRVARSRARRGGRQRA